jgi:hypothetical protein
MARLRVVDRQTARRTTEKISGTGVEPNLFQGWIATNQCIAAAEVMLQGGHMAPKRFSTIACRPDLSLD